MVAELLAAGHSAGMVLDGYCMDELMVHYEAAIRHRAEVARQTAITVRVANNAKSRQFQKYVKELEQTGLRIDQRMGRVGISVEAFFFDLDRKIGKAGNSRRRGG